ncbi:MAG: Rpp14/Pop5 family protein [Candidatus Woesearchaeota archaeon]|nr:Rpp14/Pop5 family protein [Candidatus Woesearchaeota archaeon]
MAKKLKAMMPSMRERKRYVAFQIISKEPIRPFKPVSDAIWQGCLRFLGELGAAKAGIWILADKFNEENQKGLIRVNHKYVDDLKGALALIKSINGAEVIVRSTGTSGIMKKAQERYLTNN